MYLPPSLPKTLKAMAMQRLVSVMTPFTTLLKIISPTTIKGKGFVAQLILLFPLAVTNMKHIYG
jgi:hypothetical protein